MIIFPAVTFHHPPIKPYSAFLPFAKVAVVLSLLLHLILFSAVILIKNTGPYNKKPPSPPTFELMRQIISKSLVREPVAPQQPKIPVPPVPKPLSETPRPEAVQEEVPSAGATAAVPPVDTHVSGPTATVPNNLVATVLPEEVDNKLVALYAPKIEYPERARELGIQGSLDAIITIDTSGNVYKVEMKKSPHPIISHEAKQKLSQWKFRPPRVKGVPVEVRKKLVMEFRLDDYR